MSKILFLFFFVFVSAFKVNAAPLKSLSIIGKPKYEDQFKHFSYVHPNAKKGGTLRLSDQTIFDSLNPFILKGVPAPGLAFFYGTLFEPSEDESMSFYPFIAESIDIDESKKTVTFKLNHCAKFSDGTSITADDVVFSFEMLTQKGHPKFKNYFENIEKAKKIDDLTVAFTVTCQDIKIAAASLCEFPVFSKKYFSACPFDETSLEPPVTSGPYIIQKVIPGQHIVYKRIKDWWAKDLPTQVGRHNFDTVEYAIFRDDTARFEAFKKGDTDFRFESSFQNWSVLYDFDAIKQGKVTKVIFPHKDPKPTYGIVINTRRPYLDDVRIRKVLNLMFDFYWMNEHLFYKLAIRNKSYFPMSDLSSNGQLTPEILDILKEYEKDLPKSILEGDVEDVVYKNQQEKRDILQKAQSILKDAGFLIKNGKLIDSKNNKPLTFTFLLESPKIEKIAIAFAQNLKQIGIELAIRRVDRQQYLGITSDHDFDLCFDNFLTNHGQAPIPGKELMVYFGSKDYDKKGSINYCGIHNPVIDALINQILNEKEYSKKIALTKALDFVLLKGYYRILAWSFDGLFISYWNTIETTKEQPNHLKNYIARFWAA
ncbi:MAG: hypothetical protein HEEMFOPI_00612 [Holosporales bacterium]